MMIAEFNPADIGRVVAKIHLPNLASMLALFIRRQQDRVDNMNDTVRCLMCRFAASPRDP